MLVSLLGLVLDLVVSKVASQLVRPMNATNTSNDNSFFIVRIILGMHDCDDAKVLALFNKNKFFTISPEQSMRRLRHRRARYGG